VVLRPPLWLRPAVVILLHDGRFLVFELHHVGIASLRKYARIGAYIIQGRFIEHPVLASAHGAHVQVASEAIFWKIV
jgi:hypothetical protein